jgi:hypothetical protein
MSEKQYVESSIFNVNLNFNFVDKTFIQALTFGIVAIILGTLCIALFSICKPDLPQECDKWNENYVLEMTMFLIGFVSRYLIQNETIRKYLCDFD